MLLQMLHLLNLVLPNALANKSWIVKMFFVLMIQKISTIFQKAQVHIRVLDLSILLHQFQAQVIALINAQNQMSLRKSAKQSVGTTSVIMGKIAIAALRIVNVLMHAQV
jgi:hypothetical protein